MRRLHSEEKGYALVISVILLSVMMMLLIVALDTGNSALNLSQRGVEWTRTLAVAEAGINDGITILGANRSASSACPTGGTAVCQTTGGEYQVSWTGQTGGSIVLTSVGYTPTKDSPRFKREVRVLLEPAPVFRYALFSEDVLDIKNDPTVIGDIYSSVGATLGNNVELCGGIVVANGNISLGNNSKILTDKPSIGCSGQSGLAWAGGKISLSNGAVVAGDATASAPSGTTCSSVSTSYEITSGTVSGQATACGRITSNTTNPLAGVYSSPPAAESLPAFVFDPSNYSTLSCYPSSGTCGEDNTSSTAVSSFNTYVSANKLNMSGAFAIWQTAPSSATEVDLDGIVLAGDTTIVTNAPIDFGNTSTINLAAGVESAEFVVVSLYQPPAGTNCDDNGGDCSIYGKNAIQFTRGDTSDPDDGVVGLLYTTGKMAFKNKGSPGEGALYAGAMDIKNGFDIVYNSRILRVVGFGDNLEPTLWQELDP
jgi:hypothetical protein